MSRHSNVWRLTRRVVLSCVLLGVLTTGCAKHADFVDLKDEVGTLAKNQDQTQKRQEVLQRRLQALETGRPAPTESPSGVVDPGLQQLQELSSRLASVESRLGRLEEAQASGTASDESPRQAMKPAPRPAEPQDTFMPLPGTPSISPTSAFNLAYNDYLNGRYELAVTGFQRFLKDFPGTSLVPNAHYWMGEAYFSLKDYPRALQAFQKVVTDYPRSEKVAPALFKLGVVAAESGDTPKARSHFKRVIEEFSTSDEAKLAKSKLAEIR